MTFYVLEQHWFPRLQTRWALMALGASVVLIAAVFPGKPMHTNASPLLPLHWALGIASYGLFAAALVHATILSQAEKNMRMAVDASVDVPILTLERLTFRFVWAGFVLLTATLLAGWLFGDSLYGANTAWRWDHKTVFSLLGWATFAALIAGRHLRGWRGRRATRWLYAGAGLLALAGGKVMMVARRESELAVARAKIVSELEDIGFAGVERRVQTLANVDEMIPNLRYNSAVAQIYTLVNEIEQALKSPAMPLDALREAVSITLQMIAPMMPHLAEECWAALGNDLMISQAPWPQLDESLLVESNIILPVQINGKRKGEISVPVELDKSGVEKVVLMESFVRSALSGKEPKKIVVVPGRIVNVVI